MSKELRVEWNSGKVSGIGLVSLLFPDDPLAHSHLRFPSPHQELSAEGSLCQSLGRTKFDGSLARFDELVC